jgi:hypothetical protein
MMMRMRRRRRIILLKQPQQLPESLYQANRNWLP